MNTPEPSDDEVTTKLVVPLTSLEVNYLFFLFFKQLDDRDEEGANLIMSLFRKINDAWQMSLELKNDPA